MGHNRFEEVEQLIIVPNWLRNTEDYYSQTITFDGLQPFVELKRSHPDFTQIIEDIKTSISNCSPLVVDFNWESRELLRARKANPTEVAQRTF